MPGLNVSLAAVKSEEMRRAKERSDELQAKFAPHVEGGFWAFCQHMIPSFYNDAKVPLYELTEILRRITVGELKKVLISFAPRMGKSLTTSLWIIWQLGYDNNASFMRNCYGDSLAMELSKSCQDHINSELYREVFPGTKLDYRSSSKESWQLVGTTTTTYFGAGINGTITGKGCRTCAILDDPIKNPNEALSLSFLETLELLIESVHNTRIDPNSNCAELIISTRWAEGDPIGNRLGDKTWTSFTFPMLDENNKSICEAMVTTERLLYLKDVWEKRGLSWMFSALYLCVPVSKTLGKLSLESLKRFRMADITNLDIDSVIGVCDYANRGTDYLSSPFAKIIGEKKYIIDVLFSNEDSNQLIGELGEKLLTHKPSTYVIEAQQGGTEFASRLTDKFGDALDVAGVEIETRASSMNKDVRIMLQLGSIKEDCYFLEDDEQDENYRRFFDNLTSYGKYRNSKDDAPDSMAMLISVAGSAYEADVHVIGVGGDWENKVLDRKTENTTNDLEDDDVVIF